MRCRATFALICVALAIQSPLVRGQTPPSEAVATTPDRSVVYVSRKYGFRFYLPRSWVGFTIVEDAWSPQYGAAIRIRHPLWTAENPREDLPIMIFTRQQWRDIQQDKLIVSAAPFPPSELAHNKNFVFALPPRWDHDLLEGYEEAQRILGGKCIQAF